ncbi:MAG: hypothetical protein MI810_21010 [Flavobacteriales bacterium]|nr:hypothetical protein [Flavobacteriales bacterium]
MKTPILFGLLIFLITACKKKDEPQIEEPDSPTQYELFIGNWDITSRSVDGISSLETLNETFVFTTSAESN